MKGYKVKKERGWFAVVEQDTGIEVYTSKDESKCRKLCLDLNLGSGFKGFTPSFFAINYEIGIDISA